MRVIVAAIFVYGSMLGVVGLMDSHFQGQSDPWWATLLPGIAMFLAMAVALVVFNRSGYRPHFRRRSLDEHIADLEGKGKLIRQSYAAVRCFSVSEYEDEGLHYYLELTDGRVLFLSGQYLYDYEPILDDPEFNQERTFPCTEFEVLRQKDAGYVIHIHRSGSVLEPELVAAPFTKKDFKRGIPEDGEIIEGKHYEHVKATRASP